MDRNIVYPGSIPLDTDLLATNRNAMVAIGALIQAVLGYQTIVDGLAVTPTAPASMSVAVAAGCITQLATVDATAYGSLQADTLDGLVKMGVNLAPSYFALAAPATAGQSINYLIEAAFQESDTNPVVLPYYNAANPTQPYLGPANAGTAQATQRVQRVQLQVKAGAAGATGSQPNPATDSGFVGLAVVSVAYAQTQITASNIATIPYAPIIPYKLPALRPGFSSHQAFTASGSFVVPAGVTTVKVTVTGGGGAGGTHSVLPSGGGGAGGRAIKIISGLTPGQTIPVTVGAAGAALVGGATGQGGTGGTSSFGSYVSASGGVGGIGGTAISTCAGGNGGSGVGGDVNIGGSSGTDGITVAQRGGDGGGPGNGRGSSGAITGIPANGYGGGGGGAGSSQPNASGTGGTGGAGYGGLVIVEF